MITRFVALLAFSLLAASARASPPSSAEVELWRLDCGRFDNFLMNDLSDDDRYKGQRRTLTDSCYVVRHGSDYLLWDAGFPPKMHMKTPVGTVSGPQESISAQLAQIGVRRDQIHYLAVSHWHIDHVGQAADFPRATLLIGAADWEKLEHPPKWMDTRSLGPWLTGGAPVEQFVQDKDVFGDGSVVMIATPGHTAGHHSLLVRLKKRVVMLSGDLFHLRESYDHEVVPGENESRADTLASIDRFKRLVARYKATVVISHEPSDISRLPAFPQSAQ